MKKRLILLLAAVLLLVPAFTSADTVINDKVEIEIHAAEVNMKVLTDYTYTTTVTMTKGDWFTVSFKPEQKVGAVYWEWSDIPKKALVECLNEADEVVWTREYGNIIRFLTVFPKEDVRCVRMTVLEGTGKMAELFVYKEGGIAPKAIAWEDRYDKADIMLVEAHGNDDVLVFSAVLPTYTDRNKAIQVVDIACDTIGRQRKSSPGSYLNGLRHYKTFFQFTGLHTSNYNSFVQDWIKKDSRDPVAMLVQEIRRCKPEVVVTHDIYDGDFGDGAHKLTAEITKQAVEAASDPEQYPESAKQYGAWQVKKLYFHMYPENQIKIDVDTPLASFDGKTALQLATQGYILWNKTETKQINGIKTKKYHPSEYGLAFSTVGEDVAKNDFLENIPAEVLSDYVPPTPSPTPEPTSTSEPTPEPTPEPTAEPTEEPTQEPVHEPEATSEPALTVSVSSISTGTPMKENPEEEPTEEPTEEPSAEGEKPSLLFIIVVAIIFGGVAMFFEWKQRKTLERFTDPRNK